VNAISKENNLVEFKPDDFTFHNTDMSNKFIVEKMEHLAFVFALIVRIKTYDQDGHFFYNHPERGAYSAA